MTRKERWTWIGIAVAAALALLLIAEAVGAVDASFMPKGGRTLLTELLRGDEGELHAVLGARRTEAEWNEWLAARGVNGRDRETLAAYLAVNAPLRAAARPGIALSLPRDGRDLTWDGCQTCHSLFRGTLSQTRDAQSWKKILASPAHRAVNITAAQREEIARYAEINMPMPPEAIPPSFRQ